MLAGCNVGWGLEREGGDEGRLEGWVIGENWAAGCIAGEESDTNTLSVFYITKLLFFIYLDLALKQFPSGINKAQSLSIQFL